MSPASGVDASSARSEEERKDFHSYVWGIILALALTLVAFALVHWGGGSHVTLLIIIGALALVQMIVHFRFFLHISLSGKREDLQLILFSTLVLIIMVGGTVWIMGNLMLRMAMPAAP